MQPWLHLLQPKTRRDMVKRLAQRLTYPSVKHLVAKSGLASKAYAVFGLEKTFDFRSYIAGFYQGSGNPYKVERLSNLHSNGKLLNKLFSVGKSY